MKSNTLLPPDAIAHDAVQPRRTFFKTIGDTILSIPLFGSAASAASRGSGVDLGSGDTGIMNFALALKGLEAEYYSLVMQQPYAGMTREEAHVLSDIRDHEIVHREFFRG